MRGEGERGKGGGGRVKGKLTFSILCKTEENTKVYIWLIESQISDYNFYRNYISLSCQILVKVPISCLGILHI